ncbi:MAG: HEAT repeat domain-containing protein [Pirellulales bacterium]|nr:HEAT repeat domain-containing protein [Pirellulales bacterium]
MSRRTLLTLILAAIVGGVILRQCVETRGDRERVAQRLQKLSAEFENNPTNTAPLDEITDVIHGRWSFARTYACTELRRLGQRANVAVPDLISALDCGDRFVEREAARALQTVAIGDPRPVAALTRKLAVDSRDAAWFSAEALGNIGAPALVAIPALEAASQSPWECMSYSAREALEKLRRLEKQCVPETTEQ